jgi:hypothetical protein
VIVGPARQASNPLAAHWRPGAASQQPGGGPLAAWPTTRRAGWLIHPQGEDFVDRYIKEWIECERLEQSSVYC